MNQPSRSFLTPRFILVVFLLVIVAPFLPLLITREWSWWEAWVYGVLCVLGFAVSRVLAGRRHPGLLRERGRLTQHADAKPWDRILSPLVGVGGALLPLAAGLDRLSSGPAGFSLPVRLVSLLLLCAGFTLGSYALIENAFFSGVVRIQTDRGHRVISSGPYRWLRHPGYAGSLLAYLATPFLLDSAWTLLSAVFLAVVLIVRTRLEDRTLQAELDGYRAYAQHVRYRLLPGVW